MAVFVLLDGSLLAVIGFRRARKGAKMVGVKSREDWSTMSRQSKEHQAFASLVDKLLRVPKEEILRREAVYKEQAAKNPRKRGPKPKA
jgi:hypothetical protein